MALEVWLDVSRNAEEELRGTHGHWYRTAHNSDTGARGASNG